MEQIETAIHALEHLQAVVSEALAPLYKVRPNGRIPTPAMAFSTPTVNKPDPSKKASRWTPERKLAASLAAKARIAGGVTPIVAPITTVKKASKKKKWTPEQRAAQSQLAKARWAERKRLEAAADTAASKSKAAKKKATAKKIAKAA